MRRLGVVIKGEKNRAESVRRALKERNHLIVLMGNHSCSKLSRFCLEHEGKVGWIIGPTHFHIPKEPIPFAVDNDAYQAFKKGTPFSVESWKRMLGKINRQPLWVLVPDVVADRDKTLKAWDRYSNEVNGFKKAFAVQDGMTAKDVPNCDVVFVGGTTKWKWRSLPMWTECFTRVHVGRVNTGFRLEIAERNGAESCDGSGWVRKTMGGKDFRELRAFVEGHRNRTPFLL